MWLFGLSLIIGAFFVQLLYFLHFDHFEFFLVEDVGEPLEGDFELVVKADSTDEVEELEPKVGKNFDGWEDKVDCESSQMRSRDKNTETRDVGNWVGNSLLKAASNSQKHEVRDLILPQMLYLLLEGHFPSVQLDKFNAFNNLWAKFDSSVFVGVDLDEIFLHLLGDKERDGEDEDGDDEGEDAWPSHPEANDNGTSDKTEGKHYSCQHKWKFGFDRIEVVTEQVDEFAQLCRFCCERCQPRNFGVHKQYHARPNATGDDRNGVVSIMSEYLSSEPNDGGYSGVDESFFVLPASYGLKKVVEDDGESEFEDHLQEVEDDTVGEDALQMFDEDDKYAFEV